MNWHLAYVDVDVLVEREINSWPFKANKPDVLSLFTDFPFVIKGMGSWGPSHMALLGKSICWVISVRSLTHI